MPTLVSRTTGATFVMMTAVVALVLGGCSGSTQPGHDSTDGTGHFEGQIDAGANSCILKSLEGPVPNDRPIRVDLLARELTTDPATDHVFLEIAVQNADWRPLHGPAEIIVSGLEPPSVRATNADWTTCPDSTIRPQVPVVCEFGFDYSAELGDDGILSPGEVSGYRLWVFHAPELTAFSFGATARFALESGAASISGLFFSDTNENGHHDADEMPLPAGWVEVTGPGIDGLTVRIGEDGRYAASIDEPGLYSVTGFPPPTGAVQPVRFTTPNPLQVVITAGPTGKPLSYLHADFGLATLQDPDLYPRIALIDGPPDSLSQSPFNLAGISREGDLLVLRVGYSGCQPDHPFNLFMVDGFMESSPVQARLVLIHNDLGELCEVYFERTLTFDIQPIQEAHTRIYGAPGVVRLDFVDWFGDSHILDYEP